MTTATHHHPWAQRAGQIAGRAWRGYARREQQLIGALTAQGMPARLASTALWVVKLAVLGLLLYLAFWLTLLFAFAVVAAWVARNTDWDYYDDDKPEWRTGAAGFGLYRGEVRIDGGSVDDD
ncbi:DUF3742 family protein [Burkholderia cepacia]|uniref:DUF3742 family protein n=1 Tax=Burkholderia cepacia TaxID=292 RepID=UPI00158C210D|nr:DUF3742 family protein [Burkholderia cepacia]